MKCIKYTSGHPEGIAYLGIEIRQNLSGLIASFSVIHSCSYLNFVIFIEFSGFIQVQIFFYFYF